VPNVVYLLVDQSASMVDAGKWTTAVDGITTFLSLPASAGLSVGMQLFSTSIVMGAGCAACDGSDCATPLVPAAELPGNSGDITSALAINPFGIGTPLEAPLRGGISFCQGVEAANPAVECAAVVLTDGLPTTCAMEASALASVAEAGLAAGVPTFMVGMPGADYAMLDAIAAAGGTDCDPTTSAHACVASSSMEVTDALARVVATIGTCAVP
jgi:hypothetical protein